MYIYIYIDIFITHAPFDVSFTLYRYQIFFASSLSFFSFPFPLSSPIVSSLSSPRIVRHKNQFSLLSDRLRPSIFLSEYLILPDSHTHFHFLVSAAMSSLFFLFRSLVFFFPLYFLRTHVLHSVGAKSWKRFIVTFDRHPFLSRFNPTNRLLGCFEDLSSSSRSRSPKNLSTDSSVPKITPYQRISRIRIRIDNRNGRRLETFLLYIIIVITPSDISPVKNRWSNVVDFFTSISIARLDEIDRSRLGGRGEAGRVCVVSGRHPWTRGDYLESILEQRITRRRRRPTNRRLQRRRRRRR